MSIQKIIIVVSILFFSSIMQAQIIQSYGIKSGFNNSNQRWNYTVQSGLDASHIHSISGFYFGVFFESKIFSNLSLLTEISYIQKGRITVLPRTVRAADGSGYINQGVIETKYRFHYLSLPLFLKFRTHVSFFVPFIAFGPSFEYLFSYPQSSVYDDFRKLELAFNVSTGVELSLNSLPIFLIDIRYNLGLTNSFQNENVTIDNQSIMFLLGIKF